MILKYILAVTIVTLNSNLHSMHKWPAIINVICHHPDTPQVDTALEPFKHQINIKLKDFNPPLIQAVRSGKIHTTKYLLQNGANPNIRDISFHKDTALHFLAERKDNLLYIKKYTKLAKLLITYGASPYLGDYGERPIDRARWEGNSKMVTLFESYYRWRSNNDLRKTWVTATVILARKPDIPVNTCTDIILHPDPKYKK